MDRAKKQIGVQVSNIIFLVKSLVGKDVFAYALGYYENDYKPVNPLLTPPDVRDNLWTRLDDTNGHAGLFNGNISWMITDLPAVALAKAGPRSEGMQAMLYQYDQLHRIVQARSLTSYAEGSGFASRNNDPAPYDVDYGYDPNGNLLTLHRRDHLSDTLHNFNYQYYPGTNKLRQVGPPEDITYSNGPVVSNNKLFRKIKVEGSAYIPQGRSVELRALEEIEMDPDFEAPTGTDFLAEIVADSGMYQYDAIGNLVLDQHEGVKIYWTPYGKVREVRAKNDSLITTFRYDGAGNRIEKRVRSLSSGEGWGEAVTHYVRDASGNVMGVYKDSVVSEHHVYGSSRLGMYTGGRYNGQLSLGEKNYELSNHLSNVLTTITDNIGMIEGDSTWATVVSTRDYYPFGLEMGGRSWSDTTATYRYGFNGKEKDDKGEWGDLAYDYGARIYSPTIGRWLSLDPLMRKYPDLTPYHFVANTPNQAIEVDGKDFIIIGNKEYRQKVVRLLRDLYNQSPTAREAILELASSDKIFLIVQNEELAALGGNFYKGINSSKADGYMIFSFEEATKNLDPSNGASGKELEQTPMTNFGHELGHMLDDLKGVLNTKPDVYDRQRTIVDDGGFQVPLRLPSDEPSAVKFENKIRGELGETLRTNYRGFNVFNMKVVDATREYSESILVNENYNFKQHDPSRAVFLNLEQVYKSGNWWDIKFNISETYRGHNRYGYESNQVPSASSAEEQQTRITTK